MRRAQRPAWKHPLPTALLAALALGTQLAGSLHYVLVEHVHCAEHGEIAHARHGHGAQPHDGDRAVDEIATAARTAPDANHEHCLLGVERRASVAVAPGSETSLAPARTPAAEPRTETRTPAIALYLLAPKSSPPV